MIHHPRAEPRRNNPPSQHVTDAKTGPAVAGPVPVPAIIPRELRPQQAHYFGTANLYRRGNVAVLVNENGRRRTGGSEK